MPPSDSTADGDTWLTAAAAWYVNATPSSLLLYCCAFIESSTGFAPSECSGDTHSS